MSDSKKQAARSRRPVQERSAARMAKVVAAAEHMLEELGPEKTSIPLLAERTGVPRAAIYPFFPDRYVLFSHMAQMHMTGLTQALTRSLKKPASDWRKWVNVAVRAAAAYYNAHPAASVLLLSGYFSDMDRQAHEAKNATLGTLFRSATASMGALPGLPVLPDVATIGVEIAFACMKYGYAKEGRISPRICQEATRAVVAYLAPWDRN